MSCVGLHFYDATKFPAVYVYEYNIRLSIINVKKEWYIYGQEAFDRSRSQTLK